MNELLSNLKQLLEMTAAWWSNLSLLFNSPSTIGFDDIYTLLVRWVFPLLAVGILVRCIPPLLRNRGCERIWGYLEVPGSIKIPIRHWEVSLGRSKLSDIVINLPFISRNHAVLAYSRDSWTITDLGSKGGVSINGQNIEGKGEVHAGDTISLGGAEFRLLAVEEGNDDLDATRRRTWLSEWGEGIAPGKTFLLLLLFQVLGAFQLYFTMPEETKRTILLTVAVFIAAECFYYVIAFLCSRKHLELELLAFFLCGLNLFVVAADVPNQLLKQLIAIIIGMVVFCILQFILRDMERARKLKYILAAGALVLLAANLVFGEVRFGGRNWINLGFITFQPMEFVKVAFVLAGTATLDRMLTTRNITAFIAFAGTCIGALIIMRDLGTAVVFFGAFLVIAFMRSGDLRTIAYALAAAVLGALAAITFMPYVASRFEAWGNVWQYANTIGYQQTRTMIAAASGGLLGVGGGNGFLVNVPAADTDLVFGLLCEEWGLIVALTAVLTVVFMSLFAVFLVRGCNSAFYAIAASGTATIYLIQTALNVFGSVDLLPLTGITLPFVSNGGSSMIASWALLAFIKAADSRSRPDVNESGRLF
ncbi:MAG: FtsW/RodA/SpoVE family cell cycle protein [Syntrophomonadaceae bacterium]|nr:FtsW/RodA/SpoVE family cell cycle protein [Syntrophomonadaceae bacterium]